MSNKAVVAQGAYEGVEGGLPSVDDLEVAAAAAAAAMEALAVAPFGLRSPSEAFSPESSDEARCVVHHGLADVPCSPCCKSCRAPVP